MPRIRFRSNAKPSLYAYPPLLEKEKEREKEKVGNIYVPYSGKLSREKTFVNFVALMAVPKPILYSFKGPKEHFKLKHLFLREQRSKFTFALWGVLAN